MMKCSKPRTIQMNYPAPYSHSWANTEPLRMGIDKTKKITSFQGNKKRANQQTYKSCCWQRPKPLTQGSDPYAPHLKYGLFPRKASSREPSNKAPVYRNNMSTTENRMRMEKFNKDRQKVYKKERHSSDAPLFIVRPFDKQYPRQLSLSEVTHLDIKPAVKLRPSLPFAHSGVLSPLDSRRPYRRTLKRFSYT